MGHEVRQLVEPPQGELGQHRALVRDGRIEHKVKGREPIRGHEEELVFSGEAGSGVDGGVEIAHLAGIDVDVAGKLEGRHGAHPPIRVSLAPPVATAWPPDPLHHGHPGG